MHRIGLILRRRSRLNAALPVDASAVSGTAIDRPLADIGAHQGADLLLRRVHAAGRVAALRRHALRI